MAAIARPLLWLPRVLDARVEEEAGRAPAEQVFSLLLWHARVQQRIDDGHRTLRHGDVEAVLALEHRGLIRPSMEGFAVIAEVERDVVAPVLLDELDGHVFRAVQARDVQWDLAGRAALGEHIERFRGR